MSRMTVQAALTFLLLAGGWLLPAAAQDVTGIWKGYFIADDGQQYRLEFQVKQNKNGMLSTTGVSYSWQDDIRFYGKATMTGNFAKASKQLRIREIKTVELKSSLGGACIMNYNLVYSKSGKEEFLEGTYLGKPETKGRENPYEWGDCGGGRVHLRKVATSDFYIEPFLRIPPAVKPDANRQATKPPANKQPAKNTPSVKTNTPANKTTANNNKTTTSKPAVQKPVLPKDTATNNKVTITPPKKITIPPPAVLKTRQNELVKALVVNTPHITVRLYDNGEIDGDTISVYLNNKLVLDKKMLTAQALTIRIDMEDDGEVQELVMVAENLGRIPPNTSLMIVDAGDKRYDVRITSTEQKNAMVRFRYEKP